MASPSPSSSKPTNPPIKAILFDIGGVVVLSPMLAIAAYEESHNIPAGYINHAIAHSFPHGAWSRLERNEVTLDSHFFADFSRDLSRPEVWAGYLKKVGLPGEGRELPKIDAEWLFWEMMRVSREVDPFVGVAIARLRRMEVGGETVRGPARRFTLGALTNDYKFPPSHPYSLAPPGLAALKAHFDVWISSSAIGMRKPERRIYEYAVRELGAHRKGMLKAGSGGDGKVEGEGEAELRPEEIVFLDDIGMNLKGAAGVGVRGIRVLMGETWRAVRELEGVLGLKEGALFEDGVVERLKREGKWDDGRKGSRL